MSAKMKYKVDIRWGLEKKGTGAAKCTSFASKGEKLKETFVRVKSVCNHRSYVHSDCANFNVLLSLTTQSY